MELKLSKKEIPCSLIKLKSVEKDFAFEIRFVLYASPKLLDDDLLRLDILKDSHEDIVKHDTNLAIIDTYTNFNTCSLDINCVYHYLSFLDHFNKDDETVVTVPRNFNLIKKMLEKSFRFLINEIYVSIEQIIKETSK